MDLENRTPDETVNYTIEHPLKEFAWLAGGILGTMTIMTFLAGFFAGELAARLPYRYEKALASGVVHIFRESDSESGKERHARLAIERDLNHLATRLVSHMELPQDMEIRIHFQDSALVNAYATVGANIVICGGLLKRVADENTLAMVLAHEIAHAKLRHPARSLGRGVAVGIILSAVDSGMGRSAAAGALGVVGQASLMKFSRDQERDADTEALNAIYKVYGHAGGAEDLFRLLADANDDSPKLRASMLSTHPLSDERIMDMATQVARHGWPKDGNRTPLTSALGAAKS